MNLQAVNPKNRPNVTRFLDDYWGYTLVVLRNGEQYDLKNEEGLIAVDESGAIAGCLMYNIRAETCEILSLCAVRERQGVGSTLVREAETVALMKGCKKLRVVTTNDNLNAMGFYQKRGFRLCRLFINALDAVRAVKPQVPITGENGIPLRDELEFEKNIG